MKRIAFILMLVACWPALAGQVMTQQGLMEGEVAFTDKGVTVDGKAMSLEQVIAVQRDRQNVVASPHMLHLRDGQRLAGELQSMGTGKLTFTSPVVGEHTFEVSDITAIDFEPGLGPITEEHVGRLQRAAGTAVPGTLMWIEGKELSIDSPLGVLKLSRQGLTRYVFAMPVKAGDSEELELRDGSRFIGTVKPHKGGLSLTSKRFGTRKFDEAIIAAFYRSNASTWLLIDRTYAVDAQSIVTDRYDATIRTQGDHAPRTLVLEPMTSLTWTLPKVDGVLRLMVAPAEISRGDAVLHIEADGKTVKHETIRRGEERKTIEVKLGQCEKLTLRVTFDKAMRWPCQVKLIEPLIQVKDKE